jgi:hypothetical protein
MNLIKVRRIVDGLTVAILIMLMGILPFFIVSTYNMNTYIKDQVEHVNGLFKKSEQIHNINDALIFDALEFRRIEYNCYLTSESADFIEILNGTLDSYTEYVTNDPTLTSEQKKTKLTNVSKIEKAVHARIELAGKLVSYDKTRKNYLNYFQNYVNPYQSNWHTVLKQEQTPVKTDK